MVFKRRVFKSDNAIDKVHPFYYVIPALIIYCIFFISPIILNLGAAFTDWNSFREGINFIGFQNFIELFKYKDILLVTKNTLVFTITAVLIQNTIGFFLALLLEKNTGFNRFFRAVFFLPAVISIVVWGYLFQTMLHPNGVLNNFLNFIFNTNIQTAWLGSTEFTIYVAAICSARIWTGFTMVIDIASMIAIPRDVLEAAEIEGVGFFSMIRKIKIPLIIPAISINLVISIVGSLKVFDLIIIMTRMGPGNATEVFNTWIFGKYGQGLWGFASAMNIYMIFLIAIIALPIYVQLTKKVVEI